MVRRFASVKFYYRWLRDDLGLRPDNPADALHFRSPAREARPPFTDDELRRLLAATTTEWHRHQTNRARDRALVLVLASGVRLGELTGMRQRDIDWQRQQVHVTGKRRRDRKVALGAAASDALAAYLSLAPTNGTGPQARIWRSREGNALTDHGRRHPRAAKADGAHAHHDNGDVLGMERRRTRSRPAAAAVAGGPAVR